MKYKKIGNRIWKGPPATKKFNMEEEPHGQWQCFIRPIWEGTTLRRRLHRVKVNRVNMDGVKPPYLLFCNHNSFYDFHIMNSLMKHHTGHFPGAVDDFIGREWMARRIGIFPTRKFTTDLNLIFVGRKVLKQGEVYGIYPEAKYSLCGITETIPESAGQLIKLFRVPVVTMKMKGHHIYNPYWNTRQFRWFLRTEVEHTLLFTKEEIKAATVEEINLKLREALQHDDWRWQSENKVEVKKKNRAEGLHNVLYKCPACGCETKMSTKGAQIFCGECGKSWTLNYYGELEADSGKTEFKFPSDWYKWEREEVKKEVYEGSYRTECEALVNDLPNSKGFIYMGKAHLIHDMDGFKVKGIREYDGKEFSMEIPALQQYACHIEYNYRFGWKRDCINLNTTDDTWYIFPEDKNVKVTKIALATEEIFNKLNSERSIKKKTLKQD